MVARAVVATLVAVVVGAAVGATLVWASTPTTTEAACGWPTSGTVPLGSAMALSAPIETTIGADHWYNFTVESAGGDHELSSLQVHVQTVVGRIVTPGPNWTLDALNPNGTWLGAYSLTGPVSGTWLEGGNSTLAAGQVISLMTGLDRLSGDVLVVFVAGSGECSFSGTIITAIP